MAKKTQISDTTGVTILGGKKSTKPSRRLESFPFHHTGKTRTTVVFRCKEFTCLCPVTGQPDYAEIVVSYIPNEKAVESKSFKQYLWSFRDEQGFHEDVVNRILKDVDTFLKPSWIQVTGLFNIRGGIAIDVTAEKGTRPEVPG